MLPRRAAAARDVSALAPWIPRASVEWTLFALPMVIRSLVAEHPILFARSASTRCAPLARSTATALGFRVDALVAPPDVAWVQWVGAVVPPSWESS